MVVEARAATSADPDAVLLLPAERGSDTLEHEAELLKSATPLVSVGSADAKIQTARTDYTNLLRTTMLSCLMLVWR